MAYKCKVCGQRKFDKVSYRCRHCGITICRACMIAGNCIDCHIIVNRDKELMMYYQWRDNHVWLEPRPNEIQ